MQGYSFQKSTIVSRVNSKLLKRAYRKLTSRQANVVRLPSTHSIKRSVLVKKKKIKKKTNRFSGTIVQRIYIYIYIYIYMYIFKQYLSKTLPLLAALTGFLPAAVPL